MKFRECYSRGSRGVGGQSSSGTAKFPSHPPNHSRLITIVLYKGGLDFENESFGFGMELSFYLLINTSSKNKF